MAKDKEKAQKELFAQIRNGDAEKVTALLAAGADANHIYQGGCGAALCGGTALTRPL